MAVSQHLQTDPRGRSDGLPAARDSRRSSLTGGPVPLGLSGFAIAPRGAQLDPARHPAQNGPAGRDSAGDLLRWLRAASRRNVGIRAAQCVRGRRFTGYGAFWLSFWLLNTVFIKQIPKAQQPSAEELYLLLWGIFTLYLWIVSFRVSIAVNVVLLLLVPAYALIGIGTGAGDSTIVHIGGGFGLACAAAAAYTAFAHVFNRTFEREALPLGDRSPS